MIGSTNKLETDKKALLSTLWIFVLFNDSVLAVVRRTIASELQKTIDSLKSSLIDVSFDGEQEDKIFKNGHYSRVTLANNDLYFCQNGMLPKDVAS